MEATPTSFDLNRAIEQWRAGLGESPALRRENLDELESHLRDSIASLRQRGLAEDEAFLIATRRAGGNAVLGAEFGKINSREVCLNRVIWMLVGTLAFGLIQSLVRPITELTVMLLFMPDGSTGNNSSVPVLVGLCAGCLYCLTFSGALWFGWRLLTRKNNAAAAWLQRALTRPGRSVWIAGLGCVVIQLSQCLLAGLVTAIPNRYVNLRQNWQFVTDISVGNTIAFFLVSSALVFLALVLARRQLLAKTWA